ncbi:MAG: DUF1016 domain-containing protein [Deltaproteobacteria bacterium]|nr:DUF1016 domain-containing protein [Deltaproteobacteria bacterium]
MTDLTTTTPGYVDFLDSLKERIRTARVKAALAVNREIVLLYWQIGRDILSRQAAEGWGAKVIDQLATDLRREFPGMKGLSPRNLKYMRAFAAAWTDEQIVQQAAAQIPWFHNCTILDKVKSREERLFYIQAVVQNGWSRNVLVAQIESDLHLREGAAQTNFTRTLPPPQSDLAHHVLKDPYCFDFLDLTDDAKERELERALIEHIRDFLLELGVGFAFVGSQVHLQVGERDFYLDLLFYHTRLHCYVVVELKTGEFEPEYAGKLNFYLRAVDESMRQPENDAPSIGLLLCKGGDRIVVEYALSDAQRPIGVAEWQLTRTLPKDLRDRLPSTARLKSELKAKDKTINEIKIGVAFGKTRVREFIVRVGEEYEIDPLNPQKKRNSGRRCVVTKIVDNHPDHTVWVKYLDTNKAGRPDPADLRPVKKSLLISTSQPK